MFKPPFANVTKEVEKLNERYVAFKTLFNKFDSAASGFYRDQKLQKQLITDAKSIISACKKLKLKDFSGLVVDNIKERCDASIAYLESNDEIDYEKFLQVYSLNKEDIIKIKKYFDKYDIQKISNDRLKRSYDIVARRTPTGDTEIEFLRTTVEQLLKKVYDISQMSEVVGNFEEYRKTVQLSTVPNTSSYHTSGRVMLALLNIPMVVLLKKYKNEEHADIIAAIELIGEEALVGHQGQFLLTDRADIPSCLKYCVGSTTFVAEVLGALGVKVFLDCAKEIASEKLAKEIADMQLNEIAFEELRKNIRSYMSLITDYMHFVEKKSCKQIAKYLYDYTKVPYYKSDLFKYKYKAYYAYEFLSDPVGSVRSWVYVYRVIIVEEIMAKLSKLTKKQKDFVLKYIKLGYWPKKAFLKYVDFLIKYTKENY